MRNKADTFVDRALRGLGRKYVLVGKSSVRSWHVWLAVGIVVGVLVGILFVADRTSQFMSSDARMGLAGVSEQDALRASLIVDQLTQLNAQAKILATSAGRSELDAVFALMSAVANPHLRNVLEKDKKASKIVLNLLDSISRAARPGNTIKITLGHLNTVDLRLDDLRALLPPPQSEEEAGSLLVKPDPSFSSRTVVAGSSGVEVGRFILDATNSTDDLSVRFVQFVLATSPDFDPDDLSSIQVFDAATPVNTGSYVVNLTGHAIGEDAALNIGFDQYLIVPKGTKKTVSVRANIAAGVAVSGSSFRLDAPIKAVAGGAWRVYGFSTGSPVIPTFGANPGATVTIATLGGFGVSIDPSAPTEKWVPAGSVDVPVSVLRFSSTSESVALTELRLKLRSPASASDVAAISLWDGPTQLVRKVTPSFVNGVENFVFTTNGGDKFVIPQDAHKTLTVKVDLAGIGAGKSGTAGRLVAVDFSPSAGGTKAIGMNSGMLMEPSSTQDILASGVRYFRSIPTVERVAIPVTTLTSGNQVLYKFKVTANPAYDVALREMSFRVVATGATVQNFTLRNITDGNKRVAATVPSAEIKADTAWYLTVTADTTDYSTAYVPIPAGQTHVFELRADVTTDGSGDSVSASLLGDGSYMSLNTPMGTAAEVEPLSNFVWSDYSGDVASTHSLTTRDWVNGYKVPGLLSTGLDASTISARANTSVVQFARIIDAYLASVWGGWLFVFGR